ncbi:MAG: right-handed parallel beta-helix repeat-containing protein [Phycisphaerales bacterium]|nr:right-handed parallel beta-helix repeat-containing protein [Phycisphaerales bacterium]
MCRCLALVVLLAPLAPAATINVPADHALIQDAINAANPGDEIVVAPGTYNETLNMLGKAITLRSSDPLDIGVVTATIIDAQGAGTVMTCDTGEGLDTVISGLTVTGGGLGLHIVGASPTVSYCYVAANSSSGMRNEGADPHVFGCWFVSNVVSLDGAGMYNRDDSSPLVEDCEFRTNSSSFGDGGGMCNRHSAPTIMRCLFLANTAGAYGGGIDSQDCDATIIDCEFIGNTCVDGGGGVAERYSSNNDRPRVGSVLGCRFEGNQSTFRGRGLTLQNPDLYMADVVVDGCTFVNHPSSALDIQRSSTPVTNCRFIGSGLAVLTADATTFVNCLFNNNAGASINVVTGSTHVANCTFAHNQGPPASGPAASVLRFENCVVWNNGTFGPGNRAIIQVSYSCIEGSYAGVGNIDLDPLFVDADGPDNIPGNEDDDLRLSFGSPCIDAGSNNVGVLNYVSSDIDGLERFIDDPFTVDTGDGAAPVIDIGVAEFEPPCLADADGDGEITMQDLNIVIFFMGTSQPPRTNGDVDADGMVTANDLNAVLFHFGTGC